MAIIAGTRPELIKLWPVIKGLEKKGIEFIFVWASQHYDYEMSKIFFEQLNLPEPDIFLGDKELKKDSLEDKISFLISKISKLLNRIEVPYVYAIGDTSTVLGVALATIFSGKVFIHDEAGVRSFYMDMPEEINRRIADITASMHLTPTLLASINLLIEEIPQRSIFIVGSTTIDSINMIMPIIRKRENKILNNFSLEPKQYIILTTHRRENLAPGRLNKVVKIIVEASKIAQKFDIKIVFPIHPHTKKKMADEGYLEILMKERNLIIINPLGYIDFVTLLKNAILAITDSGGIQVESAVLKTPLITLRNTSEWPETVIIGANKLVDLNLEIFRNTFLEILKSNLPIFHDSHMLRMLGDGKAGKRISNLLDLLLEGKIVLPSKKWLFDIDMKYPYLIPTILKYNDNIINKILCFNEEGFPAFDVYVNHTTKNAMCLTRKSIKISSQFNESNDSKFLKQLIPDWEIIDNSINNL